MNISVMKFGGTSLATPALVKAAARRVATRLQNGQKVVVVVSAMGRETDALLSLTGEVGCIKGSERELAALLASGEQKSAALFALALRGLGNRACSLLGWQLPLVTSGPFVDAQVESVKTDALLTSLIKGETPIVAGFQGVNALGEALTTLGRGGSDLTAVAVAAALRAEQCEIFTDVDGVYDCDPRIYANAKLQNEIGYDEMQLLAAKGAEVLQPACIAYAAAHGVRIHVRSSFHGRPGSIIKPMNRRSYDSASYATHQA